MKIEGKVIAIRLQNFMGFADTKWIELRPITLLYGWNSSGKSAIIRALLLLRQSLDSGREELLSFVADNGIDLGSFWRMVRGKNYYDREPPNKDKTPAERARLEDRYDPGELRQMAFGFRCGVSRGVLKALNVISPNDDESFIDLYLNFQWNKPEGEVNGKVELSAVTIEAPRSKDPDHPENKLILQAEWIQLKNTSGWYLVSNFFDFKRLHYPHDRKVAEQLQTWIPYFAFNSASGFLPELEAVGRDEQDEKSDKEEDAVTTIENIFRGGCASVRSLFSDDKFRYLGPIRSAPRRTYLLSELSGHKWDSSGQSAILDFLRSYREGGSSILDELNQWISDLGIGEEIHIERLKPGGQKDDAFTEAFQINICEHRNKSKDLNLVEKVDAARSKEDPDINLRDVGYGASQVLPVVLQAMAASPEVLVIIEQPELHLHPKAQSVLADLFIKKTKEGQQFLVETHSEHLLLRTQRRVAETRFDQIRPDKGSPPSNEGKDLKSANFRLIAVSRKNAVSEIESIKADKYGLLDKPSEDFQDFFKYDYEEVVELNKTIAKIKKLEQEHGS